MIAYASRNYREEGRLSILDGYRAVAILSVVAFHYTVRWAPPQDPEAHLSAGQIFNGIAPLHYGWAGVEFFFVISGFVILMTLERCRSLGDFAVRRLARLWPPLVVAATLTTITTLLIGPSDWAVGGYDYLASVFLANPPGLGKLLNNPSLKWVDGAYWSLWAEARFYALAAIVYLLSGKRFVIYWLVFQGAVFTVSAFGASGTALRVLDLLCFPEQLPYFTLGICVYEIYSKGMLRKWAVVGSISAAIIILYAAIQMGRYPTAGVGVHPNIGGVIVLNLIIFVLFFLFVINHRFVGIFGWRPLVIIGEASYSLYLIHQSIGVSIMRKSIELGISYFAILPVTMAIMLIASVILFRYVEVPAKLWILDRSRETISNLEIRLSWQKYSPR